ncbi:flavin reductase [Selenomonas caprae]|uniref:Flavin reductase n=1 Tax=Selenomonas caprae TaxID=2606905 RepID=A0A5D6WP66_9FIRM|nr:flavin reductase [Selenomonas caprae]TYZ28879.1 flavin reductase [Selenomonas caprae]
MSGNPMFNISYGLYVLTANNGQKDNGCIINTVTQVTSEPNQITLAVNKGNHTHDMIMDTKDFTVSVVSEAADFELFKHFGFCSGREMDKFKDFTAVERTANGTLAVTKGTNAYISGRVTQAWDVGSHTIFLADVVDSKILSAVKSATYGYYQEQIKPRPQATAKGKTIWRCTVCGYEYEGEELPEGYICPLCKHGAADFEKVTG